MTNRKTLDERYEVQDEDKQRALRTMATLVDAETPSGMGFAVLLFDFGPDGAMFYMSNADRNDMLRAMKAFIAKWEA